MIDINEIKNSRVSEAEKYIYAILQDLTAYEFNNFITYKRGLDFYFTVNQVTNVYGISWSLFDEPVMRDFGLDAKEANIMIRRLLSEHHEQYNK